MGNQRNTYSLKSETEYSNNGYRFLDAVESLLDYKATSNHHNDVSHTVDFVLSFNQD